MKEDKLIADAWEAGSEDYFADDPRRDAFEEGFMQGARWHGSLPLADRLSESEKEELRGIYNAGVESLNHYQRINREAKDAMQANTAVVIYNQHKERLRLLESIFGKNLFTPTEQ